VTHVISVILCSLLLDIVGAAVRTLFDGRTGLAFDLLVYGAFLALWRHVAQSDPDWASAYLGGAIGTAYIILRAGIGGGSTRARSQHEMRRPSDDYEDVSD
jgi:hypothetical protein